MDKQTWIEDYNKHRAWLVEGVKLIKLLDGECNCGEQACYICEPAQVAAADDGVFSLIVDKEEDLYMYIEDALGGYSEGYDPIVQIIERLPDKPVGTLNLGLVAQARAYWAPTWEDEEAE